MHLVYKTNLVILLGPHASHAVDDGISARVHIHDRVDDRNQGEGEHDAKPKDDVEDGWIVTREVVILYRKKMTR